MDDSRIFKRLRHTAKTFGERALQEIMSSEGGADALGVAVKGVQEGRRLLDESSVRLLGALGLATQADLERVTRKVGKLRKRLEALVDGLEGDGDA
jgi:hypothetical protein